MYRIKKKRHISYYPFPQTLLYLYLLMLILVILPLFKLIFSELLGLPLWLIEAFLFGSLFGSAINIPISSIRRYVPVVRERVVTFMGLPIVIPELSIGEEKTIIAVNLGGCIIPTVLSLYIIVKLTIDYGINILARFLIAIIINSLLIYTVAKPVPGVGIATPAFMPPLFTALITLLLAPLNINKLILFAFAYPVGTLGALIGADILNLPKIPKLGATIASIGGAGTFDGIFLTGLLSILFLL